MASQRRSQCADSANKSDTASSAPPGPCNPIEMLRSYGRSVFRFLAAHSKDPWGGVRPLLRGKLHLLMVILTPLWSGSLLTTPAATVHTEAYFAASVACLSILYNASVSALFHNVAFRWSPRANRTVNKLDYLGIFIAIAGSAFPLNFLLFSPFNRVASMVVHTSFVTLGGVAIFSGILFPETVCMATYESFRRWRSRVFVLMGATWGLFLPEIARVTTVYELGCVLGIAAFHLLGAVVYSRRRPNPYPSVFGYHEIFHCFVVGGWTCSLLLDHSILTRVGQQEGPDLWEKASLSAGGRSGASYRTAWSVLEELVGLLPFSAAAALQ
ncbi:unnamed protein product [Vitrella brassicaformis CCMP3155]|uniref:Uncharacterized protein n=1 Tax=Vitrella brassicaformis (strain CCMP3155) TaxID=1169540 RepID=A0A0G4GVJ1_VITBC|nr:unnamed protein product [Vitrella brassicaformis CCMP3155]|eukprot:CEM34760.1 unnamed protein product [Vitrella brassicaformis CCMP3155]